jgi:hypothetical protein
MQKRYRRVARAGGKKRFALPKSDANVLREADALVRTGFGPLMEGIRNKLMAERGSALAFEVKNKELEYLNGLAGRLEQIKGKVPESYQAKINHVRKIIIDRMDYLSHLQV